MAHDEGARRKLQRVALEFVVLDERCLAILLPFDRFTARMDRAREDRLKSGGAVLFVAAQLDERIVVSRVVQFERWR